MSKAPSPKVDAMRAAREARYAERHGQKKPKAREPETPASTPVETPCGYKQRSGGTGKCVRKAAHMGKHQYV